MPYIATRTRSQFDSTEEEEVLDPALERDLIRPAAEAATRNLEQFHASMKAQDDAFRLENPASE